MGRVHGCIGGLLVLGLAGASACSPEPATGCKADSDCTPDECRRARCSDGLCVQYQDDTIELVQTSTTDCRREVCRSGRRTVVPDDAEIPDDTVPCTNDRCVQGQPVHEPDATVCDTAPACRRARCAPGPGADAKGCIVELDDLAVENDRVACTRDRCSDGLVLHDPVDDECIGVLGTPAACVVPTCDPGNPAADAASGCVAIPDDGACSDTNPCTTDTCDPDGAGADPESGCLHAPIDGERAQEPGNCRHEACTAGAVSDSVDLSDIPGESDGVACTAPSCEGGLAHEAPDDSRCDDHLVCTRDVCTATGCEPRPDASFCPPATRCEPLANPDQFPTGCVDADMCPPAFELPVDGSFANSTAGTGDDFTPSCATGGAAHPDLAHSFTLAQAADVEIALEAAGRRVALTLVAVEGSSCSQELQCAAGPGAAALYVLNLPAGTYAVVVDGDGSAVSEGPYVLSSLVSPVSLQPGDLAFSEFMADPSAAGDAEGEFVEISNPGVVGVALDGLLLSRDGGAHVFPIVASNGTLLVPPGGQVVGAASDEEFLNGGIAADFRLPWSGTLANTLSAKLQLSVPGGPVIDSLDVVAAGFPVKATSGVSFQLDPARRGADANDVWTAGAKQVWCLTPTGRTYGSGDRGTPGEPNAWCQPPCTLDAECDDGNPCTRDRCVAGGACTNLPDDALVPADDGFSCTSVHCESGVRVVVPDDAACGDGVACTVDRCVGPGGDSATGCSHLPDAAQCGAGESCDRAQSCVPQRPAGDTCELAMALSAGTPLAASTAGMADDLRPSCAAERGRDAFLRVNLAQTSALAFRAGPAPAGRALALFESACGALRELACVAADGSTDHALLDVRGLDAGGYVLVVDDPDGVTDGFDATAVVAAGGLSPGDLVIDELMADPAPPLDDAYAEWIEIANPRPYAVSTGALTISSGGNGSPIRSGTGSVLRQIVVRPGALVLGARSTDPRRNGGLSPAFAFGGALGNGGDAVSITAPGTLPVVVDAVAWTSGTGGFPRAYPGRSLGLSPAKLDSALNDQGANWCAAPSSLPPYSPGNRGTPGTANPVCP